LRQLVVQGVTTNREFLLRLLASAEFQAGQATTTFVDAARESLLAAETAMLEIAEVETVSAMALVLWLQHHWRQSDPLTQQLPPGYRNNPYRDPALKLAVPNSTRTYTLSWRAQGEEKYELSLGAAPVPAEVLAVSGEHIRVAFAGVQHAFLITTAGEICYVHSARGAGVFHKMPRYPEHIASAAAGSANSPMPGVVLKVLVEAGQPVARGQALLILEAMKTEHTLRAAVDGVVEAILVKPGEIVAPGQLLVNVKAT
jgi:acetyl/propionyl-CoA carboxylase alpha subunit